MKNAAQFWDKAAPGYAKSAISDMAAYEYTCARTQSYLKKTDRIYEAGCGTGGTARFANGLCANDFLKRSSVIAYNAESLAADADDVRLMADKEGLTAHSASVDIRLSRQ